MTLNTKSNLRFKKTEKIEIPSQSTALQIIQNFVLIGDTKNEAESTYINSFSDTHKLTSEKGKVVKFAVNTLSSALSLSWGLYTVLESILNKLGYLAFQIILSFAKFAATLPNHLNKILKLILNSIKILFFSDTRDILGLNLKIDIRTAVSRMKNLTSSSVYVIQKGYLAIIVVISLFALSTGSNGLVSSDSKSFLSNFIIKNTPISNSTATISNIQKFNLLSVNANAANIQIITEYEVKSDDTLDKIALFYGVSKDTLTVNNDISEPISGKKIFIPWVDGYIYRTPDEISPEDLSQLFKIDKNTIYNENLPVLNTSTNKFKKDSLVLLPTRDYNQINKILLEIKQKLETEKKQKEEELKRQQILQYQAVPDSYNKNNADNGPKSSYGLIWPTKGTISRCYASYHTACDIANFSSPPIVAAASGTVVATYYYDVVGYGLAVVVDHGNGLKTLYAHMREISVTRGQQVSQGQQLGIMGETGQATGIHLHFECILNGVKSDPLLFLP